LRASVTIVSASTRANSSSRERPPTIARLARLPSAAVPSTAVWYSTHHSLSGADYGTIVLYSLLATLLLTLLSRAASSESSHISAHFSCLLDRVSPSAPPFRRVKRADRVQACLPRASQERLCQTAHPRRPHSDRSPSPVYPYSARRDLRHAQTNCLPRCCTSVTRNTLDITTLPSCRCC
jgi:hypothetical protein